MLKHVYRVIVMVAVFIAAVYYYSTGVEVITVEHEKTVEVGGSTFPVIYLKSQGYEINRLFGYSGNLSPEAVRESITPLGADKSFDVFINEYVEEIQKIIYEVRDAKSNELLDTGSVSALEKTEDGKMTRITLETDLNTSTEYSVKITAVTKLSRKIHYFTRIKYYMDDSFFKEKLDFVLRFHKDTFIKDENKQKVGSGTSKKGIKPYLEQLDLNDNNSTLARVDIHSSIDLITWKEIKPNVISDVIPTVKEFNIETGCFQLSYFVEVKNRSGKRQYLVKEFYRVIYASESGQNSLLNFERTMESVCKPDMLNLEANEVELGITSDTNEEVVTNSNLSKLCFVRDGSLYYYDLAKRDYTQVYSFYQENVGYEQQLYPEHDVQIVKMDEEGNIFFAVYGYMTRGDYEGKVAILLYKFHVVENSIEELAYIPLQTTYQKLKEDFGNYCYINANDDFYFTIYNRILSYNTVAKSLKVMAESVTDEEFLVLEDKNCFVWADSIEGEEPNGIHIENLETGEKVEIRAKEGEGVKLLGTIDGNIIYGYFKQSDVVETIDGTVIIPVYKLEITNHKGEFEKGIEQKGHYYTGITVHDNMITIDRSKKVKQGNSFTFEKFDEYPLISRLQEKKDEITPSFRNSEEVVKEWYISLPSVKAEEEEVTFAVTKNYVITKDATLHLDDMANEWEKYYVYAYGRITDSSREPAEAIRSAYEKMGVVISANNHLVWERGGKFKRNSISGIEKTQESGKLTSRKACIYMLLKANHVSIKVSDVSSNKGSMLGVLREYIDKPVNLTGCSLDDVLYFVSGGKPVIGMVNNKDAVLIIGYDESGVNVVDPKTGQEKRLGMNNATDLFSEAGNVFVSYLNE